MILNGMRYFGLSLLESERVTYGEYEVLADVYVLKQIDRTREALHDAFLQRAATATKNKGKAYRYSEPAEALDFSATEEDIITGGVDYKKREAFDRLQLIAKRVKEMQTEEEGGAEYGGSR